MTADEQALLAAVCADPDGDLPRLVYADWCDDHGRPERGEFIRLGCALARPTPAGPDRTQALAALRALLQSHGSRCHADLRPADGVWWGVHVRGFPERLTVDLADRPVGRLAELFVGVPVTTLTLLRRGRPVSGEPLPAGIPARVRAVSLDGVTTRPVTPR